VIVIVIVIGCVMSACCLLSVATFITTTFTDLRETLTAVSQAEYRFVIVDYDSLSVRVLVNFPVISG